MSDWRVTVSFDVVAETAEDAEELVRIIAQDAQDHDPACAEGVIGWWQPVAVKVSDD